jgi:NADH-quinone oxidoreductase subunit J
LVGTTYAIPDLITFAGAGLMVLAGAIGVVTMRNPVHAALSLVLTLFGVAVLFIEQQADFLAAVQVIVYAGAIVVLFLFVIMFLGVDRRENVEEEPLAGQRPLAYVLVLVAAAGVLALTASAHWVTGARQVAGTDKGINVADIGRSVFTTYLFAFEATAALLVIAVVGAVVLARRPSAALEEGFDDEDPFGVLDGVPDGAGSDDEDDVIGDTAADQVTDADVDADADADTHDASDGATGPVPATGPLEVGS